MTRTIEFRGSRTEVRNIVRSLTAVLAGQRTDSLGIAKGFKLSLGFAALSDIKAAFLTKAAGGTDEMGIGWPELAPQTIANRRVGPRDRKQDKRIAEYERIRKRETDRALTRFLISGLDDAEALRRARIVGAIRAGQQLGATKVKILGGRQVEILRDTGRLLNSLSPGLLSGSGTSLNYNKPPEEGGEDQIFELPSGEIIVGTNTIYASTHQHGTEHIPQRKMLPDNETPVPPVWWDRWLNVALQSLIVGVELLFRRGSIR